MTSRGSICWVGLGEARGSKPAERRPVLIIEADPFNASGLPNDSVANVTALVTLDKTDLEDLSAACRHH